MDVARMNRMDHPVPPGYIHPGYIHPGYIHPGCIHPGYIHPGYIHPGYIHPGYSDSFSFKRILFFISNTGDYKIDDIILDYYHVILIIKKNMMLFEKSTKQLKRCTFLMKK